MATVGSLVVELAASTAKFQADLGKATGIAEASARRISASMNFAKAAVAGFVSGLSIQAFAGLIKGSIDAADHLNDLAKSTGVGVETLGGIGFAAQQAGTDLDGAAQAIGKFNLSIAKAIDGDKTAAAAFAAVGISIKDLKTLSSDQLLTKFAEGFSQFGESANKSAIANAAFGKSYASIVPLLDDGGAKLQENVDYYKKFGGVTAEVARKSDEFNDSLTKLHLLQGAFARNLTGELLGPLQNLVDLWVANKEKGDGFAETAAHIADIIKQLTIGAAYAVVAFDQFGKGLGAYGAAAAARLEGDAERARFIINDFEGQQRKVQEGLTSFATAIKAARGASSEPFGPPVPPGFGKKNAPALGRNADDPAAIAKKILDGQLKGFEESIKRQQQLLSDNEHFIDQYYQDALISADAYYTARQTALRNALEQELAAYDAEVAALRAYASKAKPTERIEAETKIADVLQKRAALEQSTAIKSADLARDQTKAQKEFTDEVTRSFIALSALRGDGVASVAAGLKLANAENRKRIEQEKLSSNEQDRNRAEILERQLNEIEKLTVAQAELNAATNEYNGILSDLGRAQERIDTAANFGTLSQIDALSQKTGATKFYIQLLEKQLDVLNQIENKNPDQLRAVDALRAKLEDLKAQGDLLARTFNDIIGSAFASAVSDLVTGTKSFKDAVNDMAKSITKSIADLAAQGLAKQLFGGGGPLSGIGGFLSDIFGGKAGQDAGAGVALNSSAGALASSAAALTEAAAALTASAGGDAASGIGGIFGSLFGGGSAVGQFEGGWSGIGTGPFPFPGAANGTDFAPGGLMMVGERGPEVVQLPRGSKVYPNGRGPSGGGMSSQTVNFYNNGPIDTRTQRQLARAAGGAVTRFQRDP